MNFCFDKKSAVAVNMCQYTSNVVLIALLVIIATVCDGDPCNGTETVKTLKEQVWRSAAYSEPNLRKAKCDAAIDEGWYRIDSEAGNDTVMECVPTYKCGTHFPIWMNGSIPDVADGIVQRHMCVSYHLGCCHHNFTIRVQNCGNYRVYELTQTAGCAWAYCFGTLLITTVAPTTTTTPTTVRSEAKQNETSDGQRTIIEETENIGNIVLPVSMVPVIVCLIFIVGVLYILVMYACHKGKSSSRGKVEPNECDHDNTEKTSPEKEKRKGEEIYMSMSKE